MILKNTKNKNGSCTPVFYKNEQLFLEQERPEQETDRLFSRYWTLKESVLKATGEGMRLPLDSFELQLAEFPSEAPVNLVWHTEAGKKFSSFPSGNTNFPDIRLLSAGTGLMMAFPMFFSLFKTYKMW